MPRNASISLQNQFTRGLVTEATGLNSPENSVIDTLNVSYDQRGVATKRLGFDFEDSHVVQTSTEVDTARVYNQFLWDSVAGSGEKRFNVVQIGARIYFFDISYTNSVSSSRHSQYINLLTYKSPNFSDAKIRRTDCSFAYGRGYLFVAHPNCDTLYVSYDPTEDQFSVKRITLQIRDFEGVEDDVEVDERPLVHTNAHKYNLYNQGWYAEFKEPSSLGGEIRNVLSIWLDRSGRYPSNVDNWWYGVTTEDTFEVFSPTKCSINSAYYGNTRAPRGHYILDALDTNRRTLSGISGVTETTSRGNNPSCVAFFAGRVFYAGINNEAYSSSVYFSQIIENDEQFGKCYQEADPTSREVSDLVASDGGVLKIQNIANIIDMRNIGSALYVFATNGVWTISGTDNGDFKATDYSITKVSSFPAVSRGSIVDLGGTPIWWNYESIMMLQRGDGGFTTQITDVAKQTIKTFYDNIPHSAKQYAKGYLNDQTGQVFWLFNDNSNGLPFLYTKILVFDTTTSGFYVYSLPQSGPSIVSLIAIRAAQEITEDSQVYSASNDLVYNGSVSVVIQTSTGLGVGNKDFKFLCKIDSNSYSFAEINNEDYLDWGTADYETYFITGYMLRGSSLNKFQSGYLLVNTEYETNNSVYVQGVWDYSINTNSGKMTNPQQACKTGSTYYTTMSRKLKIRGQGRSLQFKFFGESGKPFKIIGWSNLDSINQVP